MWKEKAERPSTGRRKKKKKAYFLAVCFFCCRCSPPPPQYIPPSSAPFYPTPSWLLPAAAGSRCHHLFLYFPHLGSCNTSWLSFLADSVISARPQAGRAPRPTGDPCGCSTAGRRLCTEETARQRGCLAPLHLSV